MEYVSGVVTGLLITMFYSHLSVRLEWKKRREITNDIRQIKWVLEHNKLMCGGGFPCSGGKHCDYDHK